MNTQSLNQLVVQSYCGSGRKNNNNAIGNSSDSGSEVDDTSVIDIVGTGWSLGNDSHE